MKIHVTGAKGFLGQRILHKLSGSAELIGSDIDEMDITSQDSVSEIFSKNPPDVVVHAAAIKGNQPSQDDPGLFYHVNTTGTQNVLECARLAGVKKFVFISSISVHGPSEGPIDENHPMTPLHPYGASKAASEAFIQAYTRCYDMDAVILRPNFIVGEIPAPAPYVDNLIYSFIQTLESKGEVLLAGDGSFEREWVHPDDVALAVRLGVESDLKGCRPYLLGCNKISMMNLVKKIIDITGLGKVGTNPSMSGFSLTSKPEKARDELNWAPEFSIDDMILKIWQEYLGRKK